MSTGRETLASIEKAIEEVSADVARLTAALDKANQDKAKLVAQRLQAFQELAEFQARLAVLDGVIDEADRLSVQVRTMLQARQKTISALKRREGQATAQRDSLLAARQATGHRIDELEDKLDALGERARSELSDNPDYRAHRQRYDDLTGIVAKASEKAEQSADEEAEKGAPYRGDPLFMYLWERGYGTPRYEATGLVRWLDGWVARLIGYHEARGNFAMLTEIPKRLAAHSERLAALLRTEKDALDAMEAARIRELAGDDLPKALETARAERDRQSAELDELNAEIVETGNQLRIYAEGRDQSFREAIERTKQFLEGQRLGDLLEDARETADPGDEKIVAVIEKLASEIDGLESLAKSKRQDLDKAFARKQELLKLASDFRRARYDDPGSVFEPKSGGQALLEQLLAGLITAAEYWARTQRSQRWRTRPGDPYRRTSTFPFPPRRRSSGPDFRTGGGF